MIVKNDILSFTFNESFNINKAYIVIKNFDEIFQQLPEHRQKKLNENKREFDFLNALKKIAKNKNGVNPVKYSFSKSSKYYGRLFAKSASLQGLPRELRALLANGLYYDIDFVSCHPNLLEQYCEKKGIRCDTLSYYNNNREDVFNTLKRTIDYDRESSKNLILTLLNGGDREGLTAIDDFLKDFKEEMTTIHKLIVQLNPKIFKQVKRSWGENETNLNGKVVNRILCDLENEIMLTGVEFLMNKGYNVDCLIFDGFLIRIEDNKIVNQELLNETSHYINEITGYNLKLVNKPFDDILDLSKYHQEEVRKEDLSNEVSYYKDKEEFEKNHFKIMYPPSYVSIDDIGELYIQHTETFHQSYSHKSTKVLKGENDKAYIDEVPFTKVWIYDKNIRVYDKADFYPDRSKCPQNVYNLFKGFKAESYEPINNKERVEELVKPIIHQLQVIAQEHYEFLIIFYAFIIQYPQLKTNVNIVISGKDGCGKSIVNDFYRKKILGDELSGQTDDTDNLFSRFSNIFVKKLFLQIDEISIEDFTKKKLEKLKNITTCNTIKYEKKGFDEITINNYVNTIMTTNNDFTIPISQTDRRNIFFRCDERYVGDYTYWNEFSSHIEKIEVARAFYEYLLNYDLSSVLKGFKVESGLQFIRPTTEYTTELKALCLHPIYRFYSALTSHTYNYDCFNDNFINEEEYINIKASKLYDTYTNWYSKCGFNNKPTTLTKFFLDIKKIEGITNNRKNEGMIYTIEKNKLKEFLVVRKLWDDDAFIC